MDERAGNTGWGRRRIGPPRLRALLSGAATLLLLWPAGATAQQTADFVPEAVRDASFPLSIRSIMRGPELVGQAPDGVTWTPDGAWLYFDWLPGGHDWDAATERWRVRADGTGLEQVEEPLPDSLRALLAAGESSPEGYRVAAVDGDLFLVMSDGVQVRRVTETRERESSPVILNDGTIVYREGNNLYGIGGGGVRQLTDIRTGSPEEEDETRGHRAFLEEQQEELFEYIRRRKARALEREAEEEAAARGEPEPFYLPPGEFPGGLEISPAGSHALVTTFRQARGDRDVMMPEWITESGYTEPRDTRTKVGDVQGTSRTGILELATGEMTWLEVDEEEGEDRAGGREEAGDQPEPVRWNLSGRGWNDAGTHALLRARSDDDEQWVLYALEAATGELTELDRHRDQAWVAGPCGFAGCTGWLPDSETVFYVSEDSGFAHLYSVEADGSNRTAHTSGEWEVLDVELLEPAQRQGLDAVFLVTTNQGSPFNQHVGLLNPGGDVEYLTTGDGRYEVVVSPDGTRLALLHDVADHPPELYLGETMAVRSYSNGFQRGRETGEMLRRGPGAAPGSPGGRTVSAMATGVGRGVVVQVTETPTDEWASFDWIRPEIIRFEARDGVEVPARIYRPGDLGAEPNGAAVVFVHGAGYLHNVHNYWSSYYREYMFHHLLAARGYTVLDVDYRGSAGYGRDWRTAIYRFMGGKDLTDQEDGARWLVANEGIDPERMGVYGGSYGGFITLMALTTGDQLFRSGAALRSVTDWAHYNDGYTSNILNDPQEDREAYVRSSPIYHAGNLRDDQHLLILHGMVDANVHFSDVVRYAQRLIELGKENWEFAVYPVEGHGFVTPSSWTDEYRRIFELFERTISAPGCTENGDLCPVPGR